MQVAFIHNPKFIRRMFKNFILFGHYDFFVTENLKSVFSYKRNNKVVS